MSGADEGAVLAAKTMLAKAIALTQGYVDKGQPVPTSSAWAANLVIQAASDLLG